MNKYSVKILPQAVRELDDIYDYIAHTLLEKQTALALVDRIEAGILELETFPYRCPERTTGIYAHQGYRQLLVDNYTAVYRVDESKKQVIIVTIRYSKSQF